MESTSRAGALDATPATHAQQAQPQSVIAKVSRHLLWFLFVLFFFSFLDRINIGFAGLTMMKDLGLTSTQFGLATTLFYVAYIACGIPSNVVLARVGARRWIGTIMIAWGLASTATMFATSPGTLYVLRVLVGVTEAGFLPGILLYLTYWFPAAYRARANALFMIAMPVTAAVGSALSGFILGLDGTFGLKGWQWLFLLEGLPSAILGLVVYAYLHDSPQDARWLDAEEKRTLAATLAAEHRNDPTVQAQSGHDKSIVSELLSPAVVKFAIAYFCLVNTLAMVAVWTPLIVKSFSADASNRTIGLLAAIPQVCTIIAMIWWGRRSDRKQERKWHLMLPMLFSAAGWLCTAWSPNPALRMLGVCLASAGSYTAMSIFWTTPDHALSFRARAIGIAVINATGNISSALNPLVVGWLKDATRSFSAGLLYSAALLVIGAVVVMLLPIDKREAPRTRAA
ncbi:4-hydroxyphenylacetate permease [Paraburkholderia diazotrophica]|uniref:Putative tartrate transporter n=1 Tax=Paraburkholderia diazotrophica TaxID=667676 RepID=A0A1H6SE57_9BURK|nr:4-hydroxyphenylacetate permease [Paraburkholderia diazotrophica]SEI62035.1 MFS transporter, ACS family, 4-hydroxyphenylacetate permease [Paraburkholderia diazotrophica]